MMRTRISFLICLCLVSLLSSCSTQRNTALSRQWNAFSTRYNIYYNAKKAFDEELLTLENSFQDDYTKQLFIHPVSAAAQQEEKPSDRFAYAIEKSQKAIALKSIAKRPRRNPRRKYNQQDKDFLNQAEFNPFIHNAWLMLGKSEYYRGDFIAANSTFLYLTRKFKHLPEVVQEGRIWTAKSNIELGWIYEAENQLQQIDTTYITKHTRQAFHEAQAALALKKKEPLKAIQHLEQALKTPYAQAQKTRLRFLLAQLYQQTQQPRKAYDQYGKVIQQSGTYVTQFNARIAQTEVMSGDLAKIERKVKSLKQDSRNKTYLDQVYYALGNLALKKNDTLAACIHYQRAMDHSTRGGLEKATAALALGQLSFQQEDYLKAQKAYATAMGIITPTFEHYKAIAHRSNVLDQLALHTQTIQLQDSLLLLAQLPKDELDRRIHTLITYAQKALEKEKQKVLREAYEEQNNTTTPPQTDFTTPSMPTTDDSWYFYNKATVGAGITAFQKRWGMRKLEDHWRRKNKSTNLIDDIQEDLGQQEVESDEILGTFDTQESQNPLKPAYYLAQIPFSKQEQQASYLLIENALYEMAQLFNQELDDLHLSLQTLLRFERRFAQSKRILDVYYQIYLLAWRMNDQKLAEHYAQKIKSRFPESQYTAALRNSQPIEHMQRMVAEQATLYEQTYEAYLREEYHLVQENYEFVRKNWALSELMPQFLFLHALSFVPQGNTEAFKKHLDELITHYPNHQSIALAKQMSKGIAQGKKLAQGTVAQGMIWETLLSNDAGELIYADSLELGFKLDQNTPHLMILAFNRDAIEPNDLLFQVAKYNFTSYLVKDFDLEVLTFGELSMLIIKGFKTFDELSQYRLRMSLPQGLLLPSVVTPVMISESNFRQLLQGGNFDTYFRYIDEHASQFHQLLEKATPH